ncbi:DnaJ-domain-containing protein [Serendipita vermifera]|nr:DnaJ-domain-containing protein [Serendipita vermifera]
MDDDPVFQLFPDQEHVDLYAVLGVKSDDSVDNIKKTYRKLALLYHPDKHSASSASVQQDASTKFQQVGYAYAVLSDEKRRKRYDETGRTDEANGLGFGPGEGDEGGWEAYFEAMFEEVTRKRLDELKKEYQGSQEELDDIRDAYIEGEGSIEHIMAHIPHSTYDDEPRIIKLVKKLIKSKVITSLPQWEADLKDEKAKQARKKQGEQEAAEAEETAKELGVWDEFYGSGAKGKRGSSKKSKGDDTSNLQALIQKRAANRSTGSFLDNLAAKYGVLDDDPMEVDSGRATKSKGGKGRKKRSREEDEEEEISSKKRKTPELDDAEFERIQQRLNKQKAKNVAGRTKRK